MVGSETEGVIEGKENMYSVLVGKFEGTTLA